MQDLGGQDLRPTRQTERPRASRRRSAAEMERSWREELARIVETQIVPRLMLAHTAELTTRAADAESPPVAEVDVMEFARRLIAQEAQPAEEMLDAVRRAGCPVPEIFLNLLTPTARQLGKLWETDHCDFIEVTVGLRRLQDILRRLSPDSDTGEARIEEAPRALMLPTPGETHDFGIAMVETFFRAAGWRVQRGSADFAMELARDWYDVVGFSLSSGRHAGTLAEAVLACRTRSRNPGVHVLVGGQAFVEDETLAARVGADASAIDAPSAVHLARSLIRTGAQV